MAGEKLIQKALGILAGSAPSKVVTDPAERAANLARFMEKAKTPPLLYHASHADIPEFKRTKGSHLGFHFGDVEAANNRLEDTAERFPWPKADRDERHAIAEEHFNKLKAYEEAMRRKNAEVPMDELVRALDAGEDVGPIFKKYEYAPMPEEQAQLNALREAYQLSRPPIIPPGGVGANVGAYHVAINNPLRMPDVGNWGSVREIKKNLPFYTDARSQADLLSELKGRGYDGIVYQNRVENPVMKTDSFIAFDPEQAKSAIGNAGTFDPTKARVNEARGGEVEDALHAVRHHLAGGGFLSDLFSGPDYLSTGEAASPTNWGDPESAADFFKADKAMRLAREVQAADDVTGSVPARAPLTAPRPGAVEVQELPVNIPFAAPERGASLLSSDISPASVTSLPLAFTAAPTPAPASAAIDQATGKMTARIPEEPHGTALTKQQADYVIRTIAAETSGKSPEETQAIASVILNRINSGKYGSSPEAVLFAKRQFEPWMNPAGANYPMKISPTSQRYSDARDALEAAMAGEDITRGATNFWAPAAQEALGRPAPAWGRTGGVDIGATRFHKLERADGGLVDDALHVVREHHADGEAVGQGPVATDNSERVRAAESAANLAKQIQAYEASMESIRQQPQDIQSMTHAPEKPRAPISVEALGKNREFGSAPYDVAGPLSSFAQGAYDMKTLPLYMYPPTAPLGMAIDTAEGVASGSPTQVAMGALGGPLKVARNVIAPLAVATGVTAPDEAEAKSLSKVLQAIRAYQDPVAHKIADWNWRPLTDVHTELGLTKLPPHVQAFGDYMKEMSDKAGREGLSARDLLKGYTTTRASIQRRATDADNLRRLGLNLDPDVEKIRPEGAWMEWLGTPMGQRFLDEAAKGNISEDTVANAVKIMAPFGRHETDIPDAMRWAAKNIPGREVAASDLVHRAAQGASTPEEWRNFTSDIRGVGPSKSGFLASLYGRGDQPTLDARQIILNTGEPTKLAAPFIARSGGQGGVEAVNRLAARQAALSLKAPLKYDPFYQHLAHHAIWDKASNEMTTHGDIIKGMRNYADGGSVEDRALMLVSRQA